MRFYSANWHKRPNTLVVLKKLFSVTFPWHSCQHHCSCHTSDNQHPGVMIIRVRQTSKYQKNQMLNHFVNAVFISLLVFDWKIHLPTIQKFSHPALHDLVIPAFCYCMSVFCTIQSTLGSGSLVVFNHKLAAIFMGSSVTPGLQKIWFLVKINLIACIPSITVDTKLKPFSVHIVCKRLDARWECSFVCNKVTLRKKNATLSLLTAPKYCRVIKTKGK
jgi:hypothetical protein